MMMTLMGFNVKQNHVRNSHLKDASFYDRLVFFQLLQQAKVCNSHHRCYWGIVSTTSSYGKAKKMEQAKSHPFWIPLRFKTLFLNMLLLF
jgi:hypothetical protein